MTATTKTYTIDEFMALPDNGRRQELVRGEIREMPPAGEERGSIGMTLSGYLWTFVREHKLGRVYQDTAVVIDPLFNTVRAPDVAFVAKGRFSGPIKGAIPVPPDLAIEVISPYDNYNDVDDKVAEYQLAGVRLIWVINPRRKTVRIYHHNSLDSRIIDETGELSGEDVVPGFRIKVSTLFEVAE